MPKTAKRTFPEALARAMQDTGVYQAELARRLDVPATSVYAILHDDRSVGSKIIEQLGDALDCAITYDPGRGWLVERI